MPESDQAALFPEGTGAVSRRSLLGTAASAGLVVAGAAGGVTALAGTATADNALPYPNIVDTSHATPGLANVMRGFFSAKSRHDPDALMTFFSKDNAFYIDASAGQVWPSWQALSDVFHAFLPPAPPDALSYPIRLVGDTNSALVSFEDTPALFGSELRILGSVTFDRSGKIIRWIDYWDGRSAQQATSITSSYPTDFRDSEVNTAPQMTSVANQLQSAFAAADATAATALFSFDAVVEDMAAHTRVQGQLQIQRYFSRALTVVPYGSGASVAHVVGGSLGGGYEWTASASAAPMRRGNTALELDPTGKISRFTAIYDSGLLTTSAYQSLVLLAAEATTRDAQHADFAGNARAR
jgi:hypothetical protein